MDLLQRQILQNPHLRAVLTTALVLTLAACGAGSEPSGALPSGAVIAFSGNDVPPGWTLCDGRETATGLRTPDLRDRFILGTIAAGDNGKTGGSASHTHTLEISTAEGGRQGVDPDNDAVASTPRHLHAASASEDEHLPPFVRLMYIMKN